MWVIDVPNSISLQLHRLPQFNMCGSSSFANSNLLVSLHGDCGLVMLDLHGLLFWILGNFIYPNLPRYTQL